MKNPKSFLTKLIVKFALILFVPINGHIWEPYSPEASGRLYTALLEYSTSAGWTLNELLPVLLPLTVLFCIPGIYYDYRLQSDATSKTIWGLAIAFTIIILAGPYSLYFLFVPEGPFYYLISYNFGIFSILTPSVCAAIVIAFIFYPILEYQITYYLSASANLSESKEMNRTSTKGAIASVFLGLGIFVFPFEFVVSQESVWSSGLFWNISSWSGYEFEIRYSVNLFSFGMAFSIITIPLYIWFVKKVLDYFKGLDSMASALKIGVVAMISVYISALLFVISRGFLYYYVPIPMPFQLLFGYLAMRFGKDVRIVATEHRERVWTDEKLDSS